MSKQSEEPEKKQKQDDEDNTSKEDSEEVIEVKQDEDSNKALFIQRFFAYIIDVVIVAAVASLISYPFTNRERIDSLSEQMTEVSQRYISQDISSTEYISEASNLSYALTKENGVHSIIILVLYVLYFIVFQLYYHGQTLGKKIAKIQVISDTGELTMNQMIFRSFLANTIIFKMISLALFIFASRNVYFEYIGLFNIAQYIVTFVSIIMVMYRKDGLAVHDLVAHTRVIKVD